MTLDLATVLKAVESWSEDDRRELRDKLLASLHADLLRRFESCVAHPQASRLWDEAFIPFRRKS